MAAMNVQKRNDVTIYNLSAGPTLPEWLGDRARRNLSKRDEGIRRRIELIQDFQMPSSSNKVVSSADGRYILVGGTYPPRIRCYDVHDLSLKFERYTNSQIVDVCLLGDDYGKFAVLMEDRTIAFHAHYGSHESIRIPKFGRGMAYDSTTCELLVAASGSEIYRLNLEEGRFLEPWTMETPDAASASCISVAHAQPLAAVGCDDGVVRFWDHRSPDSALTPFLKLDVQSATQGYGFFDDHETANNSSTSSWHAHRRNPHEISSVAFDTSGLYMAAGTAGGLVALYDIRSSKPLHIQEHKHGTPIHTVKFHPGSGCVLSADEKIIKMWKYQNSGSRTGTANDGRTSTPFESTATATATTSGDSATGNGNGSTIGSVVANVEATGKLTDFIVAGDEQDPLGLTSGLVLCANDQPKLECYYIPRIGVAPKWCSFLENITEELEERDLKNTTLSGADKTMEGHEAVFENYKFVSRQELDDWGVSDLIGTPLLKAYMHGFFMDMHLYNRVKAVANPFEYEQYRKQKLKERLDAKRASRIAPKGDTKRSSTSAKSSAVNPELADRLQDKAEDATTKAGKVANQLLSDDRFGNLFTNPDYQIDEEDINFKLRNPSGVAVNDKNKGSGSGSGKRDDMDSDDDASDDDKNKATSKNDDDDDDEEDAVGFSRVGDVDDGPEGEDGDDDEDGDSDDDSGDDDGIQGGRVRGEAYDQVTNAKLSVKSKKQPVKKKQSKKKKTVLYEADEFGDANDAAMVHAGLGETTAARRVKEEIRKRNMPLEKRFQLQQEQDEKSHVKITTKGGSKELSFIPKDVRKKREEAAAKQQKADEEVRGDSKRQRRGTKDIGFKTPFRNTSTGAGRQRR